MRSSAQPTDGVGAMIIGIAAAGAGGGGGATAGQVCERVYGAYISRNSPAVGQHNSAAQSRLC